MKSDYKINNANIKEWAANYDGPLFDGILCDPPYELGFMGKSWDSSGIAFDTEMWADIYKLLKPAHEPCVLARKPIEGTVANNALKYGTGGLNIDGSRVGNGDDRTQGGNGGHKTQYVGGELEQKVERATGGRFPANLIHDGSDEVVGLFPDTKSQQTQFKVKGRSGGILGKEGADRDYLGGFNDSGSAARFFKTCEPDTINETKKTVQPTDKKPEVDGQHLYYTAKASKSERNAGLEGFEDRRAGAMEFRNRESEKKQFEGDPQYAKNYHPTVKPLSLTKYLATLIKPPTGGRLLVPFSGSGSEMIGALQAGWEYVEGVELTEEYIPIAEARIEYWTKKEKVVQGVLL